MKPHLLIFSLSVLIAGCQTFREQELATTPIAAFTVTNDGCTVACSITFTNKSTNATTYLWEFGDNTTSAQLNPVKQFTTAGTYTVKLTATGGGSSNSTQRAVTVKIVEPETVAIPNGTFQMGSTTGTDTGPVQNQTVPAFRMGKYEVTVKEYRAFCTDTGRPFPATPPTWAWVDEGPIVNVTWADAVAYCQWLSTKTGKKYRLPTEAEWEYTARGGQNFTYAGSNNPDEVAWNRNGYAAGFSTSVVGQKKPNGYETYDMSGNVEEWCSSYYGPYPFAAPNGPATGSARVVRGGWGISLVAFCAVTSRHSLPETYTYWWTGFRVAQDN